MLLSFDQRLNSKVRLWIKLFLEKRQKNNLHHTKERYIHINCAIFFQFPPIHVNRKKLIFTIVEETQTHIYLINSNFCLLTFLYKIINLTVSKSSNQRILCFLCIYNKQILALSGRHYDEALCGQCNVLKFQPSHAFNYPCNQ